MDSAAQILAIAERRMRQAGYNAVSYRDIAEEMGIKSASIHYHFPRKEDLGVALLKRYTENFRKSLKAQTASLATPQDNIAAFIGISRYALEDQGMICLGAALGAEASGLPDAVTNEIKTFFDVGIAWLTVQYKAIGVKTPADKAKSALSLLQGAMIVRSVTGDKSVFDAAAKMITATAQA